MKRGIPVLLAVALLGLPALGQLSGEWSAEISLLPTLSLTSTSLFLTYAGAFWTVTSTADFATPWGWVWQEFGVGGALGPLEVAGNMLFGPLIPDFLYAEVITGLTFGGIELGLYTALLGTAVGGYIPPGGGSVGGAAFKAASPLGGGAKLTTTVGFGATLPEDGFTIWHVSGLPKTYATDPRPGGLQFTQALLSFTGVSLCCGITYDATLSFTKAGFDYLEFTVMDLPICCGISFDATVKFTVTSKTVELKPKWAGITGCLTVYGDVLYQTATHTWDGIAIYGWKLRCELTECNYIEFLTALANREYFWLLPDGSVVYDDEPPFPTTAEPVFLGDEFEYLKLRFCGPSCCGGTYSLEIAVYFQPSGGLFGVSRVAADLRFPILSTLTVNAAFASAPNLTLAIAWTFGF